MAGGRAARSTPLAPDLVTCARGKGQRGGGRAGDRAPKDLDLDRPCGRPCGARRHGRGAGLEATCALRGWALSLYATTVSRETGGRLGVGCERRGESPLCCVRASAEGRCAVCHAATAAPLAR